MTKFLPRFSLLLSLCIFSNAGVTARYDIEKIDVSEINAINGLGTLIGKTNSDEPFVWKMFSDDDTSQYIDDPEYKIILPSVIITPDPEPDPINDPTPDPIPDITLNNIELKDLGNEFNDGSGGNVIGNYLDDDGIQQAAIWYPKKNNRDEFDYTALPLPPYKQFARGCSGNQEADFNVPECLRAEDAEFVIKASQCPDQNSNWDGTGNIFILEEGASCADNSVPICDYRIRRTREPDDVPDENSENRDVSLVNYAYDELPEFTNQSCMTKEHASVALLAMQCDNSEWKTTEENGPDPILIQCDIGAEAININTDDIVAGRSIKPDGSTRPVIWFKDEGLTTDGDPTYFSGDLGQYRFINNPDDDDVAMIAVGETEDQKEFETQYRTGFSTAIESFGNDVIGMLKFDGESQFKPVYWEIADKSSVELPRVLQIFDPLDDTKFVDFTTENVFPLALSSGLISGWYESDDGNPTPIEWALTPVKVNEVTKEELLPESVLTLDLQSNGKILDLSNSFETVGTSKIIANESDTTGIEDHAFYRTPTCGIQDLNGLLVDEQQPEDLVLEEAYAVGVGTFPSRIVARGTSTNAGTSDLYVLKPAEVFVDLEVEIQTSHNRLTVGDKHSYTIVIKNNGAPDDITPPNFASCVFFTLEATVVRDEPLEQGQERKELVGGITFLDVQSQADIVCNITRINVTCALERLDPGNVISIDVISKARPLLADRTIRATSRVFATEKEKTFTQANNEDFVFVEVDRKGCFIATAAYGSYLSNEVVALRNFRDNILLKSEIGKWLVDSYYQYSPTLADIIHQNDTLRVATRFALTPIVYLVLYPLSSLLIIFCAAAIIVLTRKRRHLMTYQR